MISAVTTAVSRGLLKLETFDNSGRWWLGLELSLGLVGFHVADGSDDSSLIEHWRKLHAQGKV